jgi:DNA polymerase III gamma/tau subunit
MEQKPFHLKYRPASFEEIIGNKAIVESLSALLNRAEGRPHAYLFTGPSGCGKTTISRILAQGLGSDPADIYEYNSANVRGIDTIREIIQYARYKPKKGVATTFIMDEFHRATVDAQNAILKILEDTPKHVYILICTTEPDKVIKTIRTRCTSYQVEALALNELTKLVKMVSEKEGVTLFPEAYREIAKKANGSPRGALVLLDQVIDIPTDEGLMNAIQNSMVSETELNDICRLLIANQTNKWPAMSILIKNFKGEPEQARRGILNYLETILLGKGDPRIDTMIQKFLENTYMNNGRVGLTSDCYFCCSLFS